MLVSDTILIYPLARPNVTASTAKPGQRYLDGTESGSTHRE